MQRPTNEFSTRRALPQAAEDPQASEDLQNEKIGDKATTVEKMQETKSRETSVKEDIDQKASKMTWVLSTQESQEDGSPKSH